MSEQKIITGEIVEVKEIDYYTIVHTYDGYSWYGTGMLKNSKEEALEIFGTWNGMKDYRVVKISLPVQKIKGQ